VSVYLLRETFRSELSGERPVKEGLVGE
jgi:hypothetical protein